MDTFKQHPGHPHYINKLVLRRRHSYSKEFLSDLRSQISVRREEHKERLQKLVELCKKIPSLNFQSEYNLLINNLIHDVKNIRQNLIRKHNPYLLEEMRLDSRVNYSINREKKLNDMSNYYYRNKEKRSEYFKNRYAENKDKIRARRKELKDQRENKLIGSG